MPNSCETPETNFCASVLAKAVKIEDSNAFSLIHDALGNIFDAEILKKVEQLATSFSELPLHILDRKIDWLKSHGIEPIDVKAIFADKTEPVAKCVTVARAKEEAEDCSISLKNEDKPSKKRARKAKRKKNQPEQNNPGTNTSTIEEVLKLKSKKNPTKGDTELDQQSISALAAEIEKVGEPLVVTKRKKKKKKKEGKPTQKNTDEQEQHVDQAVNSEDVVDCKSSTEMPMLDSGIGSGVVSGGEDKSSILSGGTVESVGENAEVASPICYNFESDGNSTFIRDYLENNEKVFFEKPSSNHNSETRTGSESSKTVEFTFGSLNLLPTEKVNVNRKVKRQRENIPSTKTSIKNINANILNVEKKKDVNLESGEFQFSFKAPTEEYMMPDQKFGSMVKSFPKFKDVEVEGDFDHISAVQFLSDEWNKTLKNPLTQWCP